MFCLVYGNMSYDRLVDHLASERSNRSPFRNGDLTVLPDEITDYQIFDYGDLYEIADRRNLNRASRERYLSMLPQITQDRNLLLHAIRINDVGLFRDWMNTNDGALLVYDPTGRTLIQMLHEISNHDHRFLDIALEYPAFRHNLQRTLDGVLDRQHNPDDDLYDDLYDDPYTRHQRPNLTVRLDEVLTVMLKFHRLRQEYLFPAFTRDITHLIYIPDQTDPVTAIHLVNTIIDLLLQQKVDVYRHRLAILIGEFTEQARRYPTHSVLNREWYNIVQRLRAYSSH